MNKPFEKGKTIKELGIDTTREFVVVKEGSFDVGDILILERDDNTTNPLFKRKSDGFKAYYTLSLLVYANREEITWDNLEVGDKFQDKGGRMTEILDIHGRIFDLSEYDEFNDYGLSITKEQLIKLGWTIVQSNKVEEMTEEQVCKELGREVKIIK